MYSREIVSSDEIVEQGVYLRVVFVRDELLVFCLENQEAPEHYLVGATEVGACQGVED